MGRLLSLFGIRYAWLKSAESSRVIKARIKTDPFGKHVMAEGTFSTYRVDLLPDGKTSVPTIWKEWRDNTRSDGNG